MPFIIHNLTRAAYLPNYFHKCLGSGLKPATPRRESQHFNHAANPTCLNLFTSWSKQVPATPVPVAERYERRRSIAYIKCTKVRPKKLWKIFCSLYFGVYYVARGKNWNNGQHVLHAYTVHPCTVQCSTYVCTTHKGHLHPRWRTFLQESRTAAAGFASHFHSTVYSLVQKYRLRGLFLYFYFWCTYSL